MTGTREYAVTQQTDQTQQATRITLPLARLRWLQEMGIAPALLRPYAPQTPAEARPAEKRTASPEAPLHAPEKDTADRKSTRLNSSHVASSYAGCCLNKV